MKRFRLNGIHMSVLKASVPSHFQTESSDYFRKLYLVHNPFAQWRHIKTKCSRRFLTIGLRVFYLHAVIFCNKDELIFNPHFFNKSTPVLIVFIVLLNKMYIKTSICSLN